MNKFSFLVAFITIWFLVRSFRTVNISFCFMPYNIYTERDSIPKGSQTSSTPITLTSSSFSIWNKFDLRNVNRCWNYCILFSLCLSSWIFHTDISSAVVVQSQALFDFSTKLLYEENGVLSKPHGDMPNGFHLPDFWHKLEVRFLILADAN